MKIFTVPVPSVLYYQYSTLPVPYKNGEQSPLTQSLKLNFIPVGNSNAENIDFPYSTATNNDKANVTLYSNSATCWL